jgi:broad specificity phosphatase PhoE
VDQSKIAVLVVFANPRGTDSLRLGTEERAIRQSIKLSRNRDYISLTTCHASTVHDLRRALLENEFKIVHISGHGTKTGLMLEDELGEPYVVPQEALAELFSAHTPPLQCVILNACFSVSQSRLNSSVLPYTIAMENSISDEAAIEFSRGFYDAIGVGQNIEFAYEEGCRTVRLAAPQKEFKSQLQKGATATTLVQSGLLASKATTLAQVYETYKSNVIADIQNNLVLEMYDRPKYEDICVIPLVSTMDEYNDTYTVFEAHRLVQFPRSVILGEPGSGKTTALRKICLDLLNQTSPIATPVYVSLASFGSDYTQQKPSSFWDYVNVEVSIHGCPDVETLAFASGAEVLLLLDGWDEMNDENAVREAKRFLAQTSVHFIITCRPEAQRTLPSVDRFEMQPLTRDRMHDFIHLRIKDSQMVDNMMMWLDHHPSMMKLAENPLNLSIMTIVFLEEHGTVGRLTRSRLYERAFDAIIRQHHREHSYDERRIYEIEQILQCIAYQTMAIGEGRFFTMRELDRAATEVLGGIPAPELIDMLIGKLGIVRDRRSGRMEFFHLWYQEFLTAKYIVESGGDLVRELSNRKLASAFPYVIGLFASSDEDYALLMDATIHDAFNFCRAVAEAELTDRQVESSIRRVLDFAEKSIPSIPVRVEMARALARVSTPAIPSLINILRDRNNSDYFRRAALEALVILPVSTSQLDKLLLELLDTEALGLLWHIIEQVGKRRVSDAREQLRQYTHHPDPIVVGDATWALREIEGAIKGKLPESEVEALLSCLTSEDLHVQGHALRTLGRLRVVSAIPRLKEHLASRNTGYRWIAPEAAALIGGQGALDLLEIALNDDDPRVVAAALKGVQDLDQDIPDSIVKRIQQYMGNTIWIASMEQQLDSIAHTTIEKLKERRTLGRHSIVFFARHCSTEWNTERKLQGTKDLPLSPEGIKEASRMGLRLLELGITRVITSPYRRAYESAQIYAKQLNVPLEENPGFRELDHGNWEGRSIPEMLGDSNCNYARWLEDATRVSVPESTESIYMAQQRAMEALRDIVLKYPNETLLVITHKHIRALLQCALKGLPLSEFGRQIDDSLDPIQAPPEQIERLYQVVKG